MRRRRGRERRRQQGRRKLRGQRRKRRGRQRIRNLKTENNVILNKTKVKLLKTNATQTIPLCVSKIVPGNNSSKNVILLITKHIKLIKKSN